MNSNHESIQTDVALIIGGPIVIAIGILILGNSIPYAADDPRAQPFYGQMVIAISVVVGVFISAVGVIRLRVALRGRGK